MIRVLLTSPPAALVVCGLLTGCASTPAAEAPPPPPPLLGVWTPSAGARLVTIDRDSTFVMVDEGGDLIILWERDPTVGSPVWLLDLPALRAGDTITLGTDSEGAHGWALRQRVDFGRDAAPLEGFVEVKEVRDDAVLAVVQVRAIDGWEPVAPLVFEGEFPHQERRIALGAPALETRSGVEHREREKPKDKPTDPVWPFNEIFRDTSAWNTKQW